MNGIQAAVGLREEPEHMLAVSCPIEDDDAGYRDLPGLAF